MRHHPGRSLCRPKVPAGPGESIEPARTHPGLAEPAPRAQDSPIATTAPSRSTAILLLDLPAVQRLLSLPELIAELRPALRAFSAGQVLQPVRTVLPIEPHHGYFGLMPAYAGALGAKLVTFYPRNEGIPTHHALIVLFRPETGEPIAVMDGGYITEVRTAAVSAIATDLLGRPDARTLCLLGAGVQARSHLAALRLVRSFTEVRVWSPRSAPAFARAHGVQACPTAEEAVRGADVIVVATGSQQPVLKGNWLSPGAHINAVGACRPDWRELDDEVLGRSRIFVDSAAAAGVESGDIMAARSPVTELGAVIAEPAIGRQSPGEITLFKSLGLAIEDLVAATLVYRAADQAPEPWPPELDALVAAPEHHTLLLENDAVRVLDTRIRPGDSTPVHTHQWPSVHHVLSWGSFVRRDAGGRVMLDSRTLPELVLSPGTVWSPPLPPHSLENVGSTELRVISVEVKRVTT